MPDDESVLAESGESQAPVEGEAAATDEAQSQEPAKEESFIDPNSLPEELKPHWKRMHSAFTKGMTAIKHGKEKISAYDQFMSNPEYARQTIFQKARDLGLSVTEAQVAANYAAANAPQANGHQATASDVPPELVQAVRSQIKPELQWAAEDIAAASWATNKMLIQPVIDQLKEQQKAVVSREYGQLAEELSRKAPGWEEKEEDMDGILNFLQDPKQYRHPVYGSKLEILHNIVTGGTRATQQAINRMAEAGRSRSSMGSAGRHAAPDLSDQIVKAKNDNEAWEIAAKDAIAKVAG